MAVRSRDLDELTRRPLAEPRDVARDILSPADDLALSDDHIFPPLRVPQLEGETSLEHMLRQIDALMQGQGPRLLPPPVSDSPSPRAARQTASPRKPVPPRRESRLAPRRGKVVARGNVGARLAMGLAVAVAALLPSNAGLLPRWPAGGPLVSWVGSGESSAVIAVASSRHPRAIAPAVFAPVPPAMASPQAPAAATPAQAAGHESPPSAGVDGLRPPAPPLLPSVEPAAGQHPKPEAAPKSSESALAPDRLSPLPAASPSRAPEERSTEPAVEIPVALLLERGNRLLAAGDITSARQFFGRAAEAGGPAAAFAMAKTYDPHFLRLINPIGVGADTARAIDWYRRAAQAGDAEAARRLQSLERETPPKFPAEARLSDLRR